MWDSGSIIRDMRIPLPIGVKRSGFAALAPVFLTVFCGFFLCLSTRATVLWQSDTNRGTGIFEGLEEAPGTIVITNDPLNQQGFVYNYNTWDDTNYAKERCESRGTKTPSGNFRVSYTNDYYIGWRAMWNPMPIDGEWVALWQMHGYGVTGQGAPLVLRCVNGDGNLYMQNGANGVDTNFWHTKFKTDVWQNFVVHVYLSTNFTQGYVEIWYNGVQQTFNNGQTRWYGPTWDNVDGSWQDSYNLFKWGVYRSGSLNGKGPAAAYMTDAKIGTTYADVDPTAGSEIVMSTTPTYEVVAPGASAVYNVGVTLNGFSGTVNLSASGLPTGATAALNPASLTNSGSSTLTITTSSSTPIGGSTISIVGNGGTAAATNTATLVVSGFQLSVTPSSESVISGNSTNFTVTVTTNSSLSGSVSLGVSGLPTATTGNFSPASLSQTGNSTLTIQTTTNTPGGVYAFTVLAANGGVLLKTNIGLSVAGVSANPGTLLWTDGSGLGTNWSTILNWTNPAAGGFGPPGSNNSVVFTNTASVAQQATVDNVVDSSVAILSLSYTHTNRYHNTMILPGATLTIATNLSVGTATDLGTNGQMYASMTGSGASLVINNTNCVVNVRQGTGSSSGPYSERATLDMSGVDTFNMTGNRFLIAADGGVTAREVGTVYLAKTNTITLYGTNPAVDMGENPSNGAGANNDPSPLTSYLYLGQNNTIFANSVSVGRSKGAGVLTFNPALAGSDPTLYLRGATGGPVSTFSVGDESALGNSNQRSLGTVDFSIGTIDALINTAYIGQSMNGTNTGTAVSGAGTLTFSDGTINVNTLEVGYQTFAAGTGPGCMGTVNVNGDATLTVNQTLELAHGNASSPAEEGILTIDGGTVQATNIIGGGGISIINVNSGTLDLQSGAIANVSSLSVGSNNVGGAALLANATALSVSNTILVAANGVVSGNTILNDAGLMLNGQIAPGGGYAGGMTNNTTTTLATGGSFVVTVEDAMAGPVAGWGFFGDNAGINVQSTIANPFSISVQTTAIGEAANFNYNTNYDWVIATANGGISNFDPGKFAVDNSQFANDLAGGYFYVRAASNALILSFTNNLPPAAQTAWMYRTGNVMTIPISMLANYWSDPDGDPVILAGVSASSTYGLNNLGTDGTNIYYTNYNALADSFTYIVQDVRTNPPAVYQTGDTIQTATGYVNILLPPVLTASSAAGNLLLSTTGGAPLGNCSVLSATNLSLPLSQWTVFTTNSFDTNGAFSLTNPIDPTQPQVFYLLQLPQ